MLMPPLTLFHDISDVAAAACRYFAMLSMPLLCHISALFSMLLLPMPRAPLRAATLLPLLDMPCHDASQMLFFAQPARFFLLLPLHAAMMLHAPC